MRESVTYLKYAKTLAAVAGATTAEGDETTSTAAPAAAGAARAAAGPSGKRVAASASTETPAAKKGKKAAPSASLSKESEVADRSPSNGTWLSDVSRVCSLARTGSESQEKFQTLALQVALEFAWNKSVTFAGNHYKTWSSLRPQLESFMTTVEKVSGSLEAVLAADAVSNGSAPMTPSHDTHASVKVEAPSPHKLRVGDNATAAGAPESISAPDERCFSLSAILGYADRTGHTTSDTWISASNLRLIESIIEAVVNQTTFDLPTVRAQISRLVVLVSGTA